MGTTGFLEELHSGRDILQHYNLLQELGILEHLDKLSGEVRELEVLLQEAGELSTKVNMDEVTEYICQKLLERVAPGYLVFIYEEHTPNTSPSVAVFKNMKRMEKMLSIPTFEPYKHFFSLSPMSVDFNVFEYMIDRPPLTSIFNFLSPKRVMPIISFSKPIGFIIIGKKIVGEDFTQKEIRYMERLITFGSISLQNTLHYQRAIVDFKTKLFNHSFLIQRMDEEIARIKRYQAQLTILILDVDFFKRFNDIHGHLAGDAVLENVADILKKSIRMEDVAARFGGEEFVIMLIQCNQNYGWLIAERIRKSIMENRVRYDGKDLNVTVSIGVAYCSSHKPVPDSSTLIHRADKALYSSKEKGRNRTTVFQNTASPETVESNVPDDNAYREGN